MDNPDDAPVRVFKLTDENRPFVADLALGGYIGKSCAYCGHVYESAADIRERDPNRGHGEQVTLVDAACWEAYIRRTPATNTKPLTRKQKRLLTENPHAFFETVRIDQGWKTGLGRCACGEEFPLRFSLTEKGHEGDPVIPEDDPQGCPEYFERAGAPR